MLSFDSSSFSLLALVVVAMVIAGRLLFLSCWSWGRVYLSLLPVAAPRFFRFAYAKLWTIYFADFNANMLIETIKTKKSTSRCLQTNTRAGRRNNLCCTCAGTSYPSHTLPRQRKHITLPQHTSSALSLKTWTNSRRLSSDGDSLRWSYDSKISARATQTNTPHGIHRKRLTPQPSTLN